MEPQQTSGPRILVFSSLFPNRFQPSAGLFVRERMFRIGAFSPLSVVAPTPWFPFQWIFRKWKPHFRRGAPKFEEQNGFSVWYPRFFSVPSVFKRFDGLAMAVCAYPRLREIRRAKGFDLIDAHFGYPDGYAAVKLGQWLGVPVTITLRGTEARHAQDPVLRKKLREALWGADRIFAVADSLKRVAVDLGIPNDKIEVIGNGVDLARFSPVDRSAARLQLGINQDAHVLISVGGLVERKGFHRVIDLLPALRQRWPNLVYLVVGGPSAEGDNRKELEEQVARLVLEKVVRFLGNVSPDDLAVPLSASDVFVLATRNEGWANVFLEAMACGLPVVTTDVGGNCEVVNSPKLGVVVPFGDSAALAAAVDRALATQWNRDDIRAYAVENSWDDRVVRLFRAFSALTENKGQAE